VPAEGAQRLPAHLPGLLIDGRHDAAAAGLGHPEGRPAQAQAAAEPAVLGPGAGAGDDDVGPETGHRHGFVAGFEQPVVDRVEGCVVGEQQRVAVGEADPVTGPGMGLDRPGRGIGEPGEPGRAAEEVRDERGGSRGEPGGEGRLGAEDAQGDLRAVDRFGDVVAVEQQTAGARHGVQRGEDRGLALGDPDAVGIDDHPAAVAGETPRLHPRHVVVQPVTPFDRVRVHRADPHPPSVGMHRWICPPAASGSRPGVRCYALSIALASSA
jgi:hypothetical protein